MFRNQTFNKLRYQNVILNFQYVQCSLFKTVSRYFRKGTLINFRTINVTYKGLQWITRSGQGEKETSQKQAKRRGKRGDKKTTKRVTTTAAPHPIFPRHFLAAPLVLSFFAYATKCAINMRRKRPKRPMLKDQKKASLKETFFSIFTFFSAQWK